jgi:hypothetical protein
VSCTDFGRAIASAESRIAVDRGAERDAGPTSKPMVEAGYWATCVICSGARRSVMVAIASSGVGSPEAVRRLSLPSDSAVPSRPGLRLEDDAVLVGLGEDGRDDALAEGAVQAVVDRARGHAEARRGVAVDVDEGRQALRAGVAGDVAQLAALAHLGHQLRRPIRSRRGVGAFERDPELGRPVSASIVRSWVGCR